MTSLTLPPAPGRPQVVRVPLDTAEGSSSVAPKRELRLRDSQTLRALIPNVNTTPPPHTAANERAATSAKLRKAEPRVPAAAHDVITAVHPSARHGGQTHPPVRRAGPSFQTTRVRLRPRLSLIHPRTADARRPKHLVARWLIATLRAVSPCLQRKAHSAIAQTLTGAAQTLTQPRHTRRLPQLVCLCFRGGGLAALVLPILGRATRSQGHPEAGPA